MKKNSDEGEHDIKGMVQHDAHDTSIEAAQTIVRSCKTKLHGVVLMAFDLYGPMTDDELQELSMFAQYGPTTVRKRRTELYQDGKLELFGTMENKRGRKMKVWRLKT